MAIPYLSLDGFIDCFFFFLSLSRIKFFPLHFIRGYWRHVGLTWHIRFIISCPGMIMVIDTVTSFPLVISYRCLDPGSRDGGGYHRRSEHYHGRLMGVNCRGACTCAAACLLMWLIPLCVMSMIGGDRRGPDWVSIPLWTNSRSVSAITSARGIQHIHHTYREEERGGDTETDL